MQAAFFQHASVACTKTPGTRFSSCRRIGNSTSAFFAPTTTKKKRVAVLRSPVRAHHGPDYVAQFEPENAAGGGLIIAAALVGRYLSTGKALNCSGLIDPVEGMSKEFLSEKLPCIVGMLVTSTVLPHLGLSHLLPAGGFELIEGTSRLALALFLVGFGSKLGGGCTSGHGLSGIGRLSSRSIVNVCTFMIFGALAATMFNTNALLHVVTETGKGKAVAAVNAITNTAAATQTDKAVYGKIIASSPPSRILLKTTSSSKEVRERPMWSNLLSMVLPAFFSASACASAVWSTLRKCPHSYSLRKALGTRR